jgi:hypothetical protein
VTKHLWPFLRLKADTKEKLKKLYRKVYIETYVRDVEGKEIKIYDWNGKRVHFNARTFDHAFSESSDYRFSDGNHDISFSKQRARCILWIKEALKASAGTIERWNQTRNDSRGRPRQRRLLLVVEEQYVIILQVRDKDHELEFITAFTADKNYIKRIKLKGGWAETKKPQS